MSSPTNQYTYQRPSTTATRSLLTNTQPDSLASTSSNDTSNRTDTSDFSSDAQQTKPIPPRQATNHYEHAAAAATKAGQIPATTAASVAASVTSEGPGGGPGGGVQRQQSWRRSDLKGQVQERLISGEMGAYGFSSTEGGK